MNKDLEYYKNKFDDYLDGHLNPEQLEELKTELNARPNLSAELERHVQARAAIRAFGEHDQKDKFNSMFDDIGPSENPPNQPKTKSALIWALLGVAVLAALFLFYNNSKSTSTNINKPLIAYLEDPSANLTRQNAKVSNGDWLAGLEAYNNQSYSQALEYFEKVRTDEAFATDNTGQLNLYSGVCNLRLENHDKAIEAFKTVPTNNPMFDEVQWYLALTYLQKGENKNATLVLQAIVDQSSHFKKGEAKELLLRIKE